MLSPCGNPGYDITIDGQCFFLKTKAAAKINPEKIHISTFIELGEVAGIRMHPNWSDCVGSSSVV
ncbi:MAG: hypothetical protein ACYDBH_21390 [Acidobacteriaceae bacterium]